MNKLFTLVLFCLSVGLAFGQVQFSDDFEGYAAGDYIGSVSSDWTTWSGATGGAEDVRTTTDQAASGSNSIFFSSTAANGGPQDVVLPFGAKYTSGLFKYSMNVYVNEGGGAYWNFQGETTIGTTWSHNCYFLETGELQFSDAGNMLGIGLTYEKERWINVAYEVNLNEGVWTIFIDGECAGSFSNEGAAVASVDIFPTLGNAFYIDDVSFSHTPEIDTKQYDVSLAVDDLGVGGLTGMSQGISGSITNLGQEVVLSIDVEVQFPDGPKTLTIDDLALATSGISSFTLPEEYTYIEGVHALEMQVVAINGDKVDEDPCNSKTTSSLRGVTPAEGKGVLIEEGTGTWCGWCPRGAVFLDRLTTKYGDRFVGVAVHNGGNDPMVVQGYDGQHGFTGYPAVTVMRASAETDFGTSADLEIPFLDYIAQAPKAVFDAEAKFDVNSRNITMDVNVLANVELTADHRLALITIEDGVSGTESGYAQSNYYAGGGEGEMGGYENLPSTVPASQMVYDHVARAIPLGFSGDSNSFSDPIAAGDNRDYTFEFPLGEGEDVNQMHVAVILINPDGTIDNANQVKVGFTSGIEEEVVQDVIVYPNPSTDNITIAYESVSGSDLIISVANSQGKTLSTANYSSNDRLHNINVTELSKGNYFAVIIDGSLTKVVKFVKE